MDADTEITLDALHDNIVAAIRAQFPDLQTVAAYPDERGPLATPACLIELTEFEADADAEPGTGQLSGTANFSAKFIIKFKQPELSAKREIRRLALAFAAFAHKRRWGLPVGGAEIMGAWPDDFDPELDQYEVWRVEWRQIVDLGESVWQPQPRPSEVWIGFAPEIGPDHVDDYVKVAPDA